MKFFVQFLFWVYLVVLVIDIFEMGLRDWPAERKPQTLGAHVAGTIVTMLMLLWAAALLYY